jgi:streptogramin lyase
VAIVVAAIIVIAAGVFQVRGAAAPAQTQAARRPAAATGMAGMATMTGTVTAGKPFKAAQVYIRNTDKRILYMVYTNAGQFRARGLFPGNYEVSVTARGLTSDVQRLAIKAGDAPSMRFSLTDIPTETAAEADIAQNLEGTVSNRVLVTLDTYDNIYPPGRGREIAESTCMICHGENFLSSQPARAEVWNQRIDRMVGKELHNRPAQSYAEGLIGYRSQWARNWSLKDREELLAYLVKNFGPGAKPRNVRTVKETPIDEVKLAKAMYMEYYVAEDGPDQGVHSSEYRGALGFTGRRVIQDVRFDAEGNVYATDRGAPRRLIRLNPRTGEMKEWLTPHPKNDIHEILINPVDGMVWLPEHTEGGGVSYINGFNPKTETFDVVLPGDPTNVIRNDIKWMQSFAMDSKFNLYIGWIFGGAITKFEPATKKTTVFPMPSANGIPYGVVPDRNDNIWVADWGGGKILKFDTHQNNWTEYQPLTYPNQTRRLNFDYEGNLWWGIWGAGTSRPGKLAKMNTSTGKITEYVIPEQAANPYDVAPDLEGNIWFPDSPNVDRSAMIGRFNTKDQTFTFYPKPQFAADTPKIQVTRDGAIWFAPRGSQKAPAISVLYPDMDRITSFGAFYVNGPPGYPFRTTVPATASAKAQTTVAKSVAAIAP